MGRFHEQLASAVGAVGFRTDGRFLWCGRSAASIPPRTRRVLTAPLERTLTLGLLRDRLYRDFYCCGGVRAGPPPEEPARSRDSAAFAAMLSRANAGSGSWEEGWICGKRDGDFLSLERDGLTVTTNARDIAPNGAGEIRPGSSVALRAAKELPRREPGFAFALGDLPWDEGAPRVNLYWNLTPGGAVRFVRLATERLNAAGLPFRLKVLCDPIAYTRSDAAVLYVHADEYGRLLPILADFQRALRPFLKRAVPVGTKELVPGVGLAEGPSGGGSFGMSRCQSIAEGLLLARDAGERTNHARLATVETHFVRNGLSLQWPYLNPGSSDHYDVPPSHARALSPPRDKDVAGEKDRSADLLSAASRIGSWLADQAIRIGEQATWLSPDSWPPRDATHGLRLSALGPDLHSGTSGIALFLAEWSVASSNGTARRLAIRALRHALKHAVMTENSYRAGIDDASVGMALAGVRVGLLLDEPALVDQGKRLARGRVAERRHPMGECRGTPGTALARLRAAELLGNPVNVRQSRAAFATASREVRQRLSWQGADLSLAHGLAGYAEVLLCGVRSPLELITPPDEHLPIEIAEAIMLQLDLLADESSLTLDQFPLGLMSGLAGIGYLFLRLRDPEVPSVLTPRREEGAPRPYRGSKFSASQTSG